MNSEHAHYFLAFPAEHPLGWAVTASQLGRCPQGGSIHTRKIKVKQFNKQLKIASL